MPPMCMLRVISLSVCCAVGGVSQGCTGIWLPVWRSGLVFNAEDSVAAAEEAFQQPDFVMNLRVNGIQAAHRIHSANLAVCRFLHVFSLHSNHSMLHSVLLLQLVPLEHSR